MKKVFKQCHCKWHWAKYIPKHKSYGFLGACLLGNLLKMMYSDIEFGGTFDHMNLPTDRLSKFKISLLVVTCSACTLSLSTPTTIFFTLLLFIIMILLDALVYL